MTTTSQAPVDGGVLAGYVDGEGPPVLVLHGGPGLSVSIVDGLVADLLPAYRVATFQQRGHRAVDDRGCVHDRRGGGRRRGSARPPRLGPGVRRGGSSWGGHLAFWVAGRLPERLLGVLAVDPLGAVGDGGNAEFEAEMERRTPEADRERAAELDRLAQEGEVSEELALESFRLFWPAYFADPAARRRRVPEPMRLSIPAYSGLFTDLVARLPELEASLPGITVPLGVVVGERSPIPNAAGRASADRVPGGWTEVVPGAGHLPWYEVPGSVRQALDRLASPLVGEQRVVELAAPLALDPLVVDQERLAPHAEPLEHRRGRGVARVQPADDPVQAELVEAEPEHLGCHLGGVAVPGELGLEHEPHLAGPVRLADKPEGDVADDVTGLAQHAEQVEAVALAAQRAPASFFSREARSSSSVMRRPSTGSGPRPRRACIARRWSRSLVS